MYKTLPFLLTIFCFLFSFSSKSCDNSSITLNSQTDNGNGTTTYNITFTVELGTGDGSYYGFVLRFDPPSGQGEPTIQAGGFPSTVPTNSSSLTGLIGSNVNSIAIDSDWNKYDNKTNVLSYECGTSCAFDDFTNTINVTVSGLVEQIFFDAHVNKADLSSNPICPYTTSAVLPVHLLSFTAKNRDNSTLLLWQTASELNNEGFVIQRSADSKTWKDIDFVKGHGTTNEVENYIYIDASPLLGINYYRLQQIDFDGKSEYSYIVSLSLDNYAQIFPNPVENVLSIDVKAYEGQPEYLEIYDLAGQRIKSYEKTNFSNTTLDVSDFNSGIYFVKVIYTNEVFEMLRFVKQ